MSNKKNRVEKAYKNLIFLNSVDARSIRILAEFEGRDRRKFR